MELALCVIAAACIPLFAWLGLRADRARLRAETCRCRERIAWPADELCGWNTPGEVP